MARAVAIIFGTFNTIAIVLAEITVASIKLVPPNGLVVVLVTSKELCSVGHDFCPLNFALECISVQGIEFIRANLSIGINSVVETDELVDGIVLALGFAYWCRN